ncbi:hypothetical protein GGF44_001692, partial [Coemansia sp. RSA 1694]
MVRQTGGGGGGGGRRTDNNNSGGGGGTADQGRGGGGGGGSSNGGMNRKTVFRPTVRAPPIGVPSSPALGSGSSGQGGGGGGGGLLLVNRKQALPATGSGTAGSDPSSGGALGSHANSASQDQAQGKGGVKSAAATENPWAVRSSQRQAAVVAATTTTTTKAAARPTAAMLNGRRHPQAMDSLLQPQPMPELAAGYDDDAEGKQHWDEMLDKGFDFSQDIEFGDGTAVRINNSRARPKLPPLKPTANAVVEPQTVSSPAISDIAAQPATGARKDPAATGVSKDPVPAPPADNASSEPPPASPPATAELLPTPRRVVETSWGKPAKPTAEASGEGAAAPASARWWKASLSGGSTPRPPPPPPQQQQQQQSSQIQAQAQAVGGRSNASANVRVELSDGNSSGGQAQ